MSSESGSKASLDPLADEDKVALALRDEKVRAMEGFVSAFSLERTNSYG